MPFTNGLQSSSASGQFQKSFFGISNLDSCKVFDCHFNPDASGYHIGYTVPDGKFAWVNRFFSYNTTLSSIGVAPVYSGNNTLFRAGAVVESTVTSNSTASNHACLMLGVPGDGFGYYATASGLNCYMSILEFPSGSMRTIYKYDNFSSGTFLIGTAGNNGTMILTSVGGILNSSSNGSLNFVNASNRTVAYGVYVVPPGQSTDNHNLMFRGTINHFLRGSLAVPNHISSGTSIYLYVDGSGSMNASMIGVDL